MLIDKRLFQARNNAELLEMAYNLLKEKSERMRKAGGYGLGEDIIELKMEKIKEILAYGTDIRKGVSIYCYTENFLEELFWEAIINAPKTIEVEIKWEGKPIFEIKEEYSDYSFETEPVDVNELIEPSKGFSPSFLRESLNDIPVRFNWTEEDTSLLADLIEDGTYLFKLENEGLVVKRVKKLNENQFVG